MELVILTLALNQIDWININWFEIWAGKADTRTGFPYFLA